MNSACKRAIVLALLPIAIGFLYPQQLSSQEKRAIRHADYNNWNELRSPRISDSGNWVCYEKNPQVGDGWLCLFNTHTGLRDSISRGYDARFSASEEFLVCKIKPTLKQARKAKLDKKKPEDSPGDSLAIWMLHTDSILRIPQAKSYLIAEKLSTWLAVGLQKESKTKISRDSLSKTDSIRISGNTTNKPEGFPLLLFNPLTRDQKLFKQVSEYVLSEETGLIAWISAVEDSVDRVSVNYFNPSTGDSHTVLSLRGKAISLVISRTGNHLAFLYSSDTTKQKVYCLYGFNLKERVLKVLMDSSSGSLPSGYFPSENFKPWYSDNGKRLFFGACERPVPERKDSLTEDEKYAVDIWHWQDPLIQPEQKANLEKERKWSLLFLADIGTGRIIPLADSSFRDVTVPFQGIGEWALASDPKPYLLETTWENGTAKDYRLINLRDGSRKTLLSKFKGSLSLSPSGNYIAWFSEEDSCWYALPTNGSRRVNLSAGIRFPFFEEENDLPSMPSPYGLMGWGEQDTRLFVYDRYDIWSFDPSGKAPPVCLTAGEGRKNTCTYRYIKTNPKEHFISGKSRILLHVFDEKTKNAGIASLENLTAAAPHSETMGPKQYSFIARAKNADRFLWTREDFSEFPDLCISDSRPGKMSKICRSNPLQDSLLWGSTRLVKWTSFDGSKLEGLLYLPDNYDSLKKYPMIVYFYERNADLLHAFHNPVPSRSTINRPYCVSNQYIVFVPDIRYEIGYPGRSAYNAIVSGTMAMLQQYPFIDADRLGLNGQSWGGYQVAWLVTRTDLFRCAMAGAPVSNMTSAYGGIRWESGKSRMFQYEEAQSRIGGTLWDKPFLYLENSPLFSANTIHTPLLIMHNDADGAVPWYQGIELYMALRRLQKPCWMLSYNNEQHNLTRRANMLDLSIRMMQFYDHYLKNESMPVWMKSGIPALQKGIDTGYE